MAVLSADLEGDVVDAHNLAAVDVDDLLIQQVARDTQHVLVVVVGDENFIAEADTVKRNGSDLIVANGEPGRSGADQVPVDAKGIHQGHDSAVPNAADSSPLQVIDRQAQQFGKKQQGFGHRKTSELEHLASAGTLLEY